MSAGWRSQASWLASGLADERQASEASQISLPRPMGGAPKKEKMYPVFNNPSLQYKNPISRIVGTSGKRISIQLIANRWLRSSCRLTGLLIGGWCDTNWCPRSNARSRTARHGRRQHDDLYPYCCVCWFTSIKPFFLPVDIEHTQCPCRLLPGREIQALWSQNHDTEICLVLCTLLYCWALNLRWL